MDGAEDLERGSVRRRESVKSTAHGVDVCIAYDGVHESQHEDELDARVALVPVPAGNDVSAAPSSPQRKQTYTA